MMNLRSLFFVSCVSLTSLVVACGGASSEAIEQQAAATTNARAATPDAGASQPSGGNAAMTSCTNIAPGPFQPQSLGQLFSGSEDFAFDGRGNIVGKRGNSLVIVGSQRRTNLATLPGQVYGLRYHPNGNLVAALPGAGKLVTVSPSGQVTDFLTGLGTPNGVYVDFDGNVWFTEFGGNKVSKVTEDGTKTVLVSGVAKAESANGIVLDAVRKLLFYTEYSKGKIHRIKVDDPNPTPSLVATIPGAALDGLVLDACGNVYAVDQGSSRLYRVRTDANGAASAAPELLATFPTNVANAQFGAGAGYDPDKLYVTGNPGTIYALDLGVAGGPVPQPWSE